MRTRTWCIAFALALAPWAAGAQTKDMPAKAPAAKSTTTRTAAPKAGYKKYSAAVCGGQGITCPIKLTVRNCEVTADPEVLTVKIKGSNPLIKWTIQSPGFSFAKDGIFFKTPGHEAEFTCNRVSDKEWHCNDKNDNPNTWHYGIKVMQGTTACDPKDPTIINDMGEVVEVP